MTSPGQRARLLPRCHRSYPALDPDRWYRVAGPGSVAGYIWLEDAGGDAFVTRGRLNVWAAHFEVR